MNNSIEQGQAQRAKGFYQGQHNDGSDVHAELAECRKHLEALTRTLTQHEYEDIMGRVKGTWSRNVENQARQYLGLKELPQKSDSEPLS